MEGLKLDLHDVNLIFFFDKDGTFLRFVKVDPEFEEVIPLSSFIGKTLKESIPIFGDVALGLIRKALETKKNVVYTKSVFTITCSATLLPLPCENVCALVSLK